MRPTRAATRRLAQTAAAGDSRSAEPAQLAGRTRPWRVRHGDAAGPRAAGWDPLNEAHPAARCLEWRSARLGNHRRVWIYTTGEAVDPQTRPLAILLDGQFWAEHAGVVAAGRPDPRGRLPPAVYLLIDAIDNQRRGVELPCHRDFWLAVRSSCRWSTAMPRSTTARIGRWWPGKASAVWRRCSPLSTGRSALAACSASQAPTGGRTVMAAGRALSANSFAGVRCPRPGCASGWKRASANRSFSREPGATGATHHNTADDFLASG